AVGIDVDLGLETGVAIRWQRRPADIIVGSPPAYPGRRPLGCRYPIPAKVRIESPASIVVGRPAEWLIGNPHPAEAIRIFPVTEDRRPPARADVGDKDITPTASSPVPIPGEAVVKTADADRYRSLGLA